MNTGNDCQNRREAIAALVLGELETPAADELKRHIDTCRACRSFYQMLAEEEETIRSAFKAIGDRGQTMADNLVEQLDKHPYQHLLHGRVILHRPLGGLRNMKRITKLAAAAVIIIAVFIGIHHFGGSIDGASIAWGQIAEAMKKMPWMHMISKGFEQNVKMTSEQWVSFESKIWAWKNADGTRLYFDYSKHENYKYDPCSETVTISYIHEDGPPVETSSPRILLEDMVKKLSEQGAKITRKDGDYKGRHVQIYEISMLQNGVNGKLQLFINPQSQLLLAGEVKGVDSNNNAIMYADIEFEYPEHGPKNIYDLGVPLSAKIVNNLPPLKVNKTLDEYRNHREALHRKYISVMIRDSTAEIIYRDGEFMTTEERYAKNKKDWKARSAEISANFVSLLDWWSNNDNSELREIYLYNGKYDYYVYGLPDNPKGYRTEGHNPNHKGVEDIGWPNISMWIAPNRELNIIETNYSNEENLICIELLLPGEIRSDGSISLPAKRLYYIDSQKDYMCVRCEFYSKKDAPWQKDKTWLTNIDSSIIPPDSYVIKEVTEFAHASGGKWYPKEIKNIWCNDTSREKERHSVGTLYLNINPTFPEGIFDPKNLPKFDRISQ